MLSIIYFTFWAFGLIVIVFSVVWIRTISLILVIFPKPDYSLSLSLSLLFIIPRPFFGRFSYNVFLRIFIFQVFLCLKSEVNFALCG
ncbi:MAG: hypothetical protein MRECE_1c125 [Mycoplasmataceae bacterium CE_OT135]|nr:MAG: hypothetical protein MRECE_1c042 [Mycoplasmataceae bacterium CE_OT135]KLL04356.1 MAG: hypothetical protein MRECE_1c125 [Mycoplasmataceae bacterium CE_OT135]